MSTHLRSFKFWCQKVLPLVYDDSLSYYEVLCKVVDCLNESMSSINELIDTTELQASQIGDLQAEVSFILKEIEKVKNGNYVSLYLDSLINWIDANIQDLVGRIVKYVVFGISNDGHFIALIPKSWQFITFDTIYDYEDPLYGHLVLKW